MFNFQQEGTETKIVHNNTFTKLSTKFSTKLSTKLSKKFSTKLHQTFKNKERRPREFTRNEKKMKSYIGHWRGKVKMWLKSKNLFIRSYIWCCPIYDNTCRRNAFKNCKGFICSWLMFWISYKLTISKKVEFRTFVISELQNINW